MKRLFALLLLCLTPVAFGQVDYTITQTPAGSPIPLQNINQNQGTPLNLGDDSISSPINLGFSFTFYGQLFNSARISNNGVISFQNPINGCCSGYNLSNPGNEYGIFAFQTDLLNMSGTTNPYYKSYGSEGSKEFTIGWYNMPVFADPNFRNTFEITLFEGSNNILLNYGDMNTGGRLYTAGIKGSNADGAEILYSGTDGNFLDFKSWTFSSGPPPPPPIPEFLYWNNLANENGTFTLTSAGVVRYGASGVYAYAQLEPGTYSCSNGFFGDPIPGVYKSCEFGSNEPPVVAVDCVSDPTNTECTINTINDIIDDITDQTMVADATTEDLTDTGSDDGSNDGTEIIEDDEEVLIAEETVTDETDLEELLSDNEEEDLTDETLVAAEDDTEDRISEPMVAATYRELTDEEKAEILADAISKNTLEGALSIAADATSTAASLTNASAVASDASSTTTRTTSSSSSNSIVAQEVATIEIKVEETKQEMTDSAAGAIDAFETGKQLGKESLASVIAASDQSATESVNQAESVAASSSNLNISSEVVLSPTSNSESSSENQQTYFAEINTESTNTQEIETSSNLSNIVATETESSDMIDEVMGINIAPVIKETGEDFEFVQQVVAQSQSQTQEENNNSGFSEDEKVTIANDPALANAFNVSPNITNLEAAGVLNQKQEEKSDAEKAADKVVAANAKEQEEINKNYMDADQSGIVAAMGADTDVTSYRTAMIRDNNNWYKPEDIYKGIIIKDNVRGSYFLEKGNTDTYKKMVEEQYK